MRPIPFVLVFALTACTRDFGTPPDLVQSPGEARFDLISVSGDTASVEACWSEATDPSGIDHYDWRNWRTLPDTIIAQDATTFWCDTLSVGIPPVNQNYAYGFEIMATDGQGNEGPWSEPTLWWLVHGDTVGPSPPDSVWIVEGDTVVVYQNPVVSVAIWPESVTVAVGESVQFYAAMLLADGTVFCTDATAQATERPWTHEGCDSAVARL
jgi:hypothetical protein